MTLNGNMRTCMYIVGGLWLLSFQAQVSFWLSFQLDIRGRQVFACQRLRGEFKNLCSICATTDYQLQVRFSQHSRHNPLNVHLSNAQTEWHFEREKEVKGCKACRNSLIIYLCSFVLKHVYLSYDQINLSLWQSYFICSLRCLWLKASQQYWQEFRMTTFDYISCL